MEKFRYAPSEKLVEYIEDRLTVPRDSEQHTFGPRVMMRLALEQANMIRAALAIGEGKLKSLPKGIIGDGSFCVLARALSNGWKPNVGDSEFMLIHADDGTVDFKECVAALKEAGFKNVRTRQFLPKSRKREFVARCITARTPMAMGQLISSFDEGDIPSLIMDDESPRVTKMKTEQKKRWYESGVQKFQLW